MFTKLSPQKVRHTSGYIVQVIDRFHVEYIHGNNRAVAEVEFAPIVGLYRNSLIILSGLEGDRDVILKRIVSGLEEMGAAVEVC